MKHILALSLMLVAAMAQARVQPAPWITDHMVLQRNRTNTLRGTADAGETVVASLAGRKYTAVADASGCWQMPLPPMPAGGPHTLTLADRSYADVCIGDVWLCSGQSNMELPVRRVMDMFAAEIEATVNPMCRLLKIERQPVYDGPAVAVQTSGWQPLSAQTSREFSALAYFYALEMHRATGVPQGVVQAAVGGTPIEAWMSREALADYPEALARLAINADAGYRQGVEAYGALAGNRWERLVAEAEAALGMDWKSAAFDDSAWTELDVLEPDGDAAGLWSVDSLGCLNGAHWFRKRLTVSAAQASQPATLRLGCLVDADDVFVNGRHVGSTGYQYPPRIYAIPQGTLHEGENVIAVRLLSQGGRGRFVADKYRGIFFGDNPWLCGEHADRIDLDDTWRHFYAVPMPAKQGVPFFYYTPTVLFNGMVAPLAGMGFAGALWYQGESNTSRAREYRGLLQRLMQCWRATLGCPDLGFGIVALADFERPVTAGWRMVQQAQHDAAAADANAVCISAADLGEWNDIHPLDKKEVARRLARAMMPFVADKNQR